jgi:toxin-antitoxin system PIN domain toxin
MIGVDTNVLVYAHRTDLPQHARAEHVVSELLVGSEPVAFCWPVVHEFMSIVTNPRLFRVPTPAQVALDQVEHWLSSPRAHLLHESRRHLSTLGDLILAGRVVGGVVHDARIAAMCLDHGVRELLTSDRDFTRFPLLAVRNPLVG